MNNLEDNERCVYRVNRNPFEPLPKRSSIFGPIPQNLFSHAKYSFLDLLMVALNKGIDLSLYHNVQELKDLCQIIMKEVPSVSWQQEMIFKENQLSLEERSLIQNYINYGYKTLNQKLRDNPNSPAPLNNIIDKMIPLSHDIIVYRVIREDSKFKLPTSGIFTSYGYLSTTFDTLIIQKDVCEEVELEIEAKTDVQVSKLLKLLPKTVLKIMKIKVPKGTKCYYVSSYNTSELIFKHNIRLMIHKIFPQKFICSIPLSKSPKVCIVHEADIYDCEILT